MQGYCDILLLIIFLCIMINCYAHCGFSCFYFENSSQLPLSIVAHSNIVAAEGDVMRDVFFLFIKQGVRLLSHEMEKVLNKSVSF